MAPWEQVDLPSLPEMPRRAFLAGITGGLLAAPLDAEAQQGAKVARMGYLASSLAASPHLHEAFRQGLRDRGYIEGRSVVEARGPADFERAFSDMARARADALAVLPSPTFLYERGRLADLAARDRLPTLFAFREYVDAGGLMSYGPDIADMYRRAATYVDKILTRAHPGDLVINVRTAKAFGLTIPPSLLQRADQVIE